MAGTPLPTRSRNQESEATRRAILDAAEHLLATRRRGAVSRSARSARAPASRRRPSTITSATRRRWSTASSTTASPTSTAPSPRRAAPADPVEALRWGFDRYVEYGARAPDALSADVPARATRGRRRGGLASYDRLRRTRDRRSPTPVASRPPVEDATAAFWAAVHGVTSLADRRLLDARRTGDRARARRHDRPTHHVRRARDATPAQREEERHHEPSANPTSIRFCRATSRPGAWRATATDLEVDRRDPARAERHLLPQRPQPRLRAARPLSLVRRRRHDPRDPHRGRPRLLPQPLGRERRPARGARGRPRAAIPASSSLSATEAPRFKNTANTNIVFARRQAAGAGRGVAADRAASRARSRPSASTTSAASSMGPMTAHPKMDPETGEMLFFGYSPFPPYLQYHVADRERRARAQRGDRRRLAVDDARLRDHRATT